MAHETAANLQTQADDLEAQGHQLARAGGPLDEVQAMWADADRLRARAADLEAARIDWRKDVPRLVHDAARRLLGGRG